jgi:hypothetical protein
MKVRFEAISYYTESIVVITEAPFATRCDLLIWLGHVNFVQGRSGLITFLGQNARYANSNSVLPVCLSTESLR